MPFSRLGRSASQPGDMTGVSGQSRLPTSYFLFPTSYFLPYCLTALLHYCTTSVTVAECDTVAPFTVPEATTVVT
jgi:hypothetical protein